MSLASQLAAIALPGSALAAVDQLVKAPGALQASRNAWAGCWSLHRQRWGTLLVLLAWSRRAGLQSAGTVLL